MFSPQQKRKIAMKVQAALQETADYELPLGEVNFILHVDGADPLSWANIRNNSGRDVLIPAMLDKNMSVKKGAKKCPRVRGKV